MGSLAERLEQARIARGLERKELAAKAAISLIYLSYLITGKRTNPSITTIRKLAEALGVSYDWLVRGVGDMDPVRFRPHVPLMGYVPAGRPLPAVEEVQDLVSVPDDVVRHHPTFALIVRGDSMLDHGVIPGDLIFIRTQETADDGDIVVAMLEDRTGDLTVTLKRFRRRPGYAILQPGNHRYQPMLSQDVKVLGKMVGKRV